MTTGSRPQRPAKVNADNEPSEKRSASTFEARRALLNKMRHSLLKVLAVQTVHHVGNGRVQSLAKIQVLGSEDRRC